MVKDLSWAAWAGFVVSTLVELTSRIGGRAAPHLPGLGAAQWLATQLISSIALAAGSPAAFVMAAVPPAAVVATAPAALADTTPAAVAGTTREAIRLTGTVPPLATTSPAAAHAPAGGAPTATGHVPSRPGGATVRPSTRCATTARHARSALTSPFSSSTLNLPNRNTRSLVTRLRVQIPRNYLPMKKPSLGRLRTVLVMMDRNQTR
ncbi:hypothetical protein [Microbispora sp. H10949]|uniref:hypothetical protein n=1 Tax=Microbispora sp. H10949 TaxID=2729111 RepID=UPI0016013E1E|nr:hypothetical protein [Microbispora sp. H10949]